MVALGGETVDPLLERILDPGRDQHLARASLRTRLQLGAQVRRASEPTLEKHDSQQHRPFRIGAPVRMSGPRTAGRRSRQPSTTKGASQLVAVAIATPLETDLVASIRAISDQASVPYQPELLPPTRYPDDHHGPEGFRRDPQAEGRWQELLARAEVLLGIPADSAQGLTAVVRGNPAPLLEQPPKPLPYGSRSWGPEAIDRLIAPHRWHLPYTRNR